MTRLLAAIVLVAAVATAGDYIWYEGGVEHRMWIGIVHGALLLTAVGGVFGALAGRTLVGLPAGAVAGVSGALTYYACAAQFRQAALFVAWATLWVVLALFDGRMIRRHRRSVAQSLIQGLTAAVLSGATFYLVVGTLWGRAPASGRNYLLQFGAWAIAWAPGILAIALDPKGRGHRE